MRRDQDEDRAYDEWRQRLLDALIEGCEAGRLKLAADLCPYFAFEPEYKEWHKGRMETLCQEQRRAPHER